MMAVPSAVVLKTTGNQNKPFLLPLEMSFVLFVSCEQEMLQTQSVMINLFQETKC